MGVNGKPKGLMLQYFSFKTTDFNGWVTFSESQDSGFREG